MKVKQSRLAFSYIRFSTPEQRLGDSLRRQIAGAEAWCKAEGLTLDSTLRDEGVSGYRRRNATEGALSTFLTAIRAGEVTAGSVLIVESLDRLSRAEPLDALDLLRDIIKAGIEVVTLHDRQRYSSASMREIGPLLQALVIMSRAHEESHVKAQRLGESWGNKRRLAVSDGTPMTRQVPAWIKVDGVRANSSSRHDWSKAKFALIPDRAEIIREIFERRVEGWGRRRIANSLNRRELPVWGRGKRKATGGWQESYIAKILNSRTVLGEYQPYKLEAGRYSQRVPVGDPILNYYPAVIDNDLWLSSHANDIEKRTSKGRPSSTAVLSGLLYDPAGAPMHVERKGDGCDYYVTSRAFRRPDKPTHRWRMDHLEEAVLMLIREINWSRVFNNPIREPELRRLRAQLAECDRETAEIKAKLKAAAARSLDPDFESLRDEFKTTVAEIKERQAVIQERWNGLTKLIESIEGENRAAASGSAAERALAAVDLKNEKAFNRLRRELKTLVRRITLYPDGNVEGFDLDEFREIAVAMLTGNQGLVARGSGRVCGALVFQFVNARTLTVFVTHRLGGRSNMSPVLLHASGAGFGAADIRTEQRHLTLRRRLP